MSDPQRSRGELAAYLVGGLEPAERDAFEAELRESDALSAEARELGNTAALLREAAPPFEPPHDLASRVHQAVIDSVSQAPSVPAEPTSKRAFSISRPAWSRRLALAGGLAAILAAAVFAGAQIGASPEGELEVSGDLASEDGTALASVEVREIGIGRIVDLESDELPILPKGEYYEVWFVGAGDSPADPNRISAGTFHPDADGSSDVELKAAVDPARFPVIEITSEPGDGDPAPSGSVVAALDSSE